MIDRLSPEVLRFLATASAGLAIDIAIAWALIAFLGFADIAAAACGLFAGMVFNYFVHMGWTFRDHGRSRSVRHFLQYGVSVAITLAIRALVLGGIAAMGWQEVLPPVVRLAIGAAVSFVVSYTLCRRVIFPPETRPAP